MPMAVLVSLGKLPKIYEKKGEPRLGEVVSARPSQMPHQARRLQAGNHWRSTVALGKLAKRH